jgi:small-conductance mechanosensitive channel
MNTSTRDSMRRVLNIGSDLGRSAVLLGWQAVRLPLLSVLVILEPIVRIVLSGVAVMGLLTAFVFKFSGAAPHFPFWLVVAISIGCVLMLATYYWIVRLLSR